MLSSYVGRYNKHVNSLCQLVVACDLGYQPAATQCYVALLTPNIINCSQLLV